MKQKIINFLLKAVIVLTLLFVVFSGILGWYSQTQILRSFVPVALCVLLILELNRKEIVHSLSKEILLTYVIALAVLLVVFCFFLHEPVTKTVQLWVVLIVIAFPYEILWSSNKK